MSDTIRAAARKTSQIVMEADMAIELLEGFGHPRINTLGVLHDPRTFVPELRSVLPSIEPSLIAS